MILRTLLNSYEYAEKSGFVDKHEGNKTILLPLYHTNSKSNGKEDIIEVSLRKDGTIFSAKSLLKDEVIIFPVTENSIARSGKNPPAHPLVDKIEYFIKGTEANKLYMEEFKKWFEYEKKKNSNSYRYLEVIKKFIDKESSLNEMIKALNSDKIKVVEDILKSIITFKIIEWDGDKDVSVTDNIELHNAYIDYVRSCNKEKDKGICNITGKEDVIAKKHRGLMGNAKVISVSNNIETYRGRFAKGEDIIAIGYETSEKIHLMLKYLLDNKNSCTWLGESEYMVNWFSEELSNESGMDITNPNDIYAQILDNEVVKIQMVTADNKKVGDSFKKGQNTISLNANYYIAIVDKASNGRISVKYFRELKVSELLERLEKWIKKYSWEIYNKDKGEYQLYTQRIFGLFLCAYGVERDGKLKFDKGAFIKDQYQKLISALIDGKDIPLNITKNIGLNVRQRMKYDKTWGTIYYTALGVLSDKMKEKGEEMYMLQRENEDRSYLYGRLLAVLQLIEEAVYSFDDNLLRETNAEKFWNSFVNRPATISFVLRNKVQVYLTKLDSLGKKGLKIKYDKELQEIFNKISELYMNDKSNNKPLNNNFLYGYYNERKDLLSKKTKEDDSNDK